MGLGLLTGAFLKGAADNVAGAISKAEETARQDKLLKDQRAYDEKQIASARQFQVGRADESRRQVVEDSLIAQVNADDRARLAQEQKVKADLAAQANAEALAREARENKVSDTIGERTYQAGVTETALRNQRDDEQAKIFAELASEREKIARQNEERERIEKKLIADPNAPVVLPTGFTINRPSANSEDKGGPGVTALYATTIKNPDGTFSSRIVSVPDPIFDDKNPTETMQDTWAIFSEKVGSDLPRIIQSARKGDPQALEDFGKITNWLNRFAGATMLSALKLENNEGEKAGKRLYRNPILRFALDRHIPNKQDQKYFIDNYFAKIVPEMKTLVNDFLGIHPDVDLGIKVEEQEIQGGRFGETEQLVFIDIPKDAEKLNWATDGNGTVKEIFKERLLKLSKFSQTPVATVLRTFWRPGSTDKSIADAMDAVIKTRTRLVGTFMESPGNRTDYTYGFVQETTDLFEAIYNPNNIRDSISNGINVAGLLMEPKKLEAQAVATFNTDGSPAFDQKYYRSKFGINREAASEKAQFAKDTLNILGDIEASVAEGANLGALGQIVTSVSGFQGFVEGVSKFMERSDIDPEVKRNLQQRLGQATEGTEEQRAQGKLNYLIEALAFAIAGSLQGGAKGNNISNQDIQNVKEGLNLGKLLSSEVVAGGTLEYLRKKMQAVYTINQAFATAQTEKRFRSVFIYNNTMNIGYDPVRNGDSILEYWRDDPDNPANKGRPSSQGQRQGNIKSNPGLSALVTQGISPQGKSQ